MASSKKRPSSEELKGLLLEGNFGVNSDAPLPLTDPISTTQMVLKLSDIKPYDKNPRREKNPAYDDIKASIRSKKQLNNNFNVTRRPGDDKFMVESGGNTRLAILKELYQETGDEAFNTVHCLFIPWKSEASVLTAHLIENEMRGDMTLIDKAYAVQELKRELEVESGKTLPDRQFTRLTSDIGFKISPKLLRRFNYAIKLDQMIPLVLRAGLGGNKIDQIKKVENAYADYCQDKTNQFDSAFMAVMSESDTNDFWDFDEVRKELDERLSELTGIRENLLRLQVDAILFNRPGEIDYGRERPLGENEDSQSTSTITPIDLESAQSIESFTAANDTHEQSLPKATNSTNNEDRNSLEPELKTRVDQPAGLKQKPSPQKTATPLHILWDKGYNLAMKIAGAMKLDTHCIMPVKCGMGFYVELPAASIVTRDETGVIEYPHNASSMCWWMLAAISEQLSGQECAYVMWSHTEFYQLYGDSIRNPEEPNEVEARVAYEPQLIVSGNQMFHSPDISDIVFTDFFRLMENSRKIKQAYPTEKIWSIHPTQQTEPS
jgi:ParB family protein of integrating conjugative element (PFGI_1 class)